MTTKNSKFFFLLLPVWLVVKLQTFLKLSCILPCHLRAWFVSKSPGFLSALRFLYAFPWSAYFLKCSLACSVSEFLRIDVLDLCRVGCRIYEERTAHQAPVQY